MGKTMNLYENELYLEDLYYVSNQDFGWDKLNGKTILLSGATGLIGSFFVDVIMTKNLNGLDCNIYALSRNEEKARARFSRWENSSQLKFISSDINKPLIRNDIGTVEYVLHLASNTHPIQYATDPIGTIMTNITGLKNMLDFSVEHKTSRFAFASSNEIYGENRGDKKKFDENYCGYIDCNTVRAGYPESKRCGEALCQAYIVQKNMDVVIPRFTRSYGPTMQISDSKAISQFIKNGISGEDIVLKSAGTQYYSYTYVADAISGLLSVLFSGKRGEAYNIADETSDIMLKDLAQVIAKATGKKVIYEAPDIVESTGYSKATKARLDGSKMHDLGWHAKYDIKSGIERTLKILRTTQQSLLKSL